ncbi:MAG: hypothetical protein AAF591_12505 [Verrucomicrobiota bacterium]
MKRVIRAGALLVILLVLGSCNLPPRGFDYAEQKAVIPNYFLLTGYEPLNDWLDEPLPIRMHNVRIEEALHMRPLGGIQYRIEHYPHGDEIELFSIDSPGMTRRQLLWGIARHFSVGMHVEYIDNLPSAIVISERI